MKSLDLCCAPGCKRGVFAKELCETHYRRQRRGGDVSKPIRESRGELVSLSTRVTVACETALNATGNPYKTAAEVLEKWAARTNKKVKPGEETKLAF